MVTRRKQFLHPSIFSNVDMTRSPPFFIIGCVRSGTTMLRNILRLHPNLAAPEETHFYRWTEPFGTDVSNRQFINNAILKKHRQIDSIDEAEFQLILDKARTRKQLYQRYMKSFVQKTKPEAGRWFDKTPQNVYGAAMLAADFPHSRFIHIVRNPLDVVLSLRTGQVMQITSLIGACNYWREAVVNIATLKKAIPRRVLELNYEEFTAAPREFAGKLLDFIGEPFDADFMDAFVSKPVSYDHSSLLSPEERRMVRDICGTWASSYGYEI